MAPYRSWYNKGEMRGKYLDRQAPNAPVMTNEFRIIGKD